jgi:hypothetical protein
MNTLFALPLSLTLAATVFAKRHAGDYTIGDCVENEPLACVGCAVVDNIIAAVRRARYQASTAYLGVTRFHTGKN